MAANQIKNKPTEEELELYFDSLWAQYPLKRGKGQVSHAKKLKLWNVGYGQMTRAIQRYLHELAKEADWRKPQNGSTFFNSGYVDYLDANYDGDFEKKNEISRKPQSRIEIVNGEEVTVFE